MAFTLKLNKLLYEVHLLSFEIKSQVPGCRVYCNEVEKMHKKCAELYKQTIEMDNMIRLSREGTVSKYKMEELWLDLDLILENVKFVKQQLDIHVKHEQLTATLQNQTLIYSSSDENGSIQCTVKTPEKVSLSPVPGVPEQRLYNTPKVPSTPSSSSCSPWSSTDTWSSSSWDSDSSY